MHPIQEKLLNVIGQRDISGMTLKRIGELVSEPTPQKIKHHLLQLERKGLISINKQNGKIQKIVSGATSGVGSFISVPIMGSANCGPQACFAENNIEGYLKLSRSFLPEDYGSTFILRAIGDSMNKANIKGKSIDSGDYVLVNGADKQPEDNSYVVSVIDSLANIKKLHIDRAHHQAMLLSESSRPSLPIVIHGDDEYQIAGKVFDVLKFPKMAESSL